MKPYRTIMITELNKDLIMQWESLWARAVNQNIHNSYTWFQTCLETYPKRAYEIYACFHNDTLVGIVPLFLGKRFGVKVLIPVGEPFVIDTAFLIEKHTSKIYTSLFEQIAAHRNLYLPRIEQKTSYFLHARYPRMLFSLLYVAPHIDLDGSDPLRYYSKSNLKEIRSIMRRYKDALSFKIYDQNDDLESCLQTMIHIDTHSAKQQKSMDVFSKIEYQSFFLHFIRHYRKYIHISILAYEGKPVAYTFSYIHVNRFIGYQASYLPEYKKLSPGRTIFVYLLDSLRGSSIKIFDLCGGLNTYKTALTPTVHFNYDLYYSTNQFIMLWWRLIHLVGRLKQNLFPKKFSLDHEYIFRTLS